MEKSKTAQRETSAQKEVAKVSNVDKYNEVIASETERIDQLKKKFETKSEFLGSSLMKPVYGKKGKVDSGKKEKTSKKKSLKMEKACQRIEKKDQGMMIVVVLVRAKDLTIRIQCRPILKRKERFNVQLCKLVMNII